jgi:hypothetical protein
MLPVAVPVGSLAVLVVLSLLARERNYLMTSTGLMMLTAVLAGWFAAMFWIFG